MRFYILSILILLGFYSFCQEIPEEPSQLPETNVVDTLAVKPIDEMADEKNALYSAVLPGLGQYNNKQYVKGGLILGGFTFGLINTLNNSKEFKTADEAYTNELINFTGDTETLNLLYDQRREILSTKDIWTAATTYIYVGNLIDAAAQYKIIREEEGVHSPTKAAYYSAILPGLGQAYNKKYWKIPLVYAALGTSLYFAENNRDFHRDYLREIEYRSIGETTGFRALLSEEKLEESLEQWREWRDMAYIATGVVYFLNIIDATVDAHLYDFPDEDEMNLSASPVIDIMNGQPYYAVQFSIPINLK